MFNVCQGECDIAVSKAVDTQDVVARHNNQHLLILNQPRPTRGVFFSRILGQRLKLSAIEPNRMAQVELGCWN